MSGNIDLHASKKRRKHEFYTQLNDIEKELCNYKDHFRDKIVYCNCDDPKVSNFFKYFVEYFEHLGLKKLITTCYKNKTLDMFSQNDSEQSIYIEYEGDKDGNRQLDPEEIETNTLKGDGDFQSEECIELLKQADIVVTNPPFDLFIPYVAQLIKYEKKFLIIGNQTAITYKEIYPLIGEGKIWLGYAYGNMEFEVPQYYPPKKSRYRMDENGRKYYSQGNTLWFTNLDIEKRQEKLDLWKQYLGNENLYPEYDNYNGINVKFVKDIPEDYAGVMGVPITFLLKHNPEQFEIVGFRKGDDKRDLQVNGKNPFFRILIRNKTPKPPKQ